MENKAPEADFIQHDTYLQRLQYNDKQKFLDDKGISLDSRKLNNMKWASQVT
jgi:hypothetical protein